VDKNFWAKIVDKTLSARESGGSGFSYTNENAGITGWL